MLKGCQAPEMKAGLDTGPVQLCAVAVTVLDPDFGGIFGAGGFRLGLRELGDPRPVPMKISNNRWNPKELSVSRVG